MHYDELFSFLASAAGTWKGYLLYLYLHIHFQTNYRPPSTLGEQIPTSDHVYNADPAKPKYNDWFHVSRDSRKLL
jgi:hypothetical protein